MSEATESAVEAKEKDRRAALIIAILALFLALSEAGAKNAQHLSTEKNIESSDLYNFYQAKKVRSTIFEAASEMLESQRTGLTDQKAQEALEQAGRGISRRRSHNSKRIRRSLKTAWTQSRNEPTTLRKVANWPIVGSNIMNLAAASSKLRSCWRQPQSSPASQPSCG